MDQQTILFETERLRIRKAMPSDADVDLFYRLWNHPEVMANVGFPHGLGLSRAEIRQELGARGSAWFQCRLVAIRKSDGMALGECKMALPDANGVSETDVKLLPQFWNQGYGTEIKKGLVQHLFTQVPECLAIKADPKLSNVASQKMQERAGARRIEPGGTYPIARAEAYLPGRDACLYMVFRKDWERTAQPG